LLSVIGRPAAPVLGCRLVARQGRDPTVPAALDPVWPG